MADNFAASKVQTDAHVQATEASGESPVTDINRDFEERATEENAKKMGMSYIDISSVHINPDHLEVLSAEEASKAMVIPFFKIGKKVRLALAHPTDPNTQEVIRKLKAQDFSINVNLASESGIRSMLQVYSKLQKGESIQIENIIDEKQIQSYHAEIENLASLKNKIKSVTAEEALNFLNVGALKTGASDIHYQPEENRVVVRFRIDGVLQEVLVLDLNTFNYIANQLKYKAGMRLNVTNVPQDGRYYFKINDDKVDVRVASLPTEYGESFVCRLLDARKKSFQFEELGYEGRNLALLKKALTLPNGMVLVTGPTGSGKTTTLYSLLNALNKPENKIITLEDPIEYHIQNITQSQINEKRGYTFGSGLRSILRQDPDIVMLGEIRDLDTAETAAQAALTGHILLSTLHTNSAVETLPRLLNIGLKPYMIAPALSIVVAQRLVRKICTNCAQQVPITDVEKAELSAAIAQIHSISPELQLSIPATLPHAPGCDKCSSTGYLGQIAIAEVFENTPELQELILAEKATHELFKHLRSQGMTTIGEDGVLKVLRGLTTLSEVERVSDVTVQAPQSASTGFVESSPEAPAPQA